MDQGVKQGKLDSAIVVRPTASAAVLALLLACSGASPGASPDTSDTLAEAPDWLGFEVRYSPRHSLGKRRLDVLTTNLGREEIVISSIALQADHFTPLPPEPKNTRIGPGVTIAVKTDFGDLTGCEQEDGLQAAVVMEMAVGGGEVLTYRASLDPEPLDRIRAVECQERAVREAIKVSFAESWTVTGSRVVTDLVLESTGEPVMVDSVGGMILFGMEAVAPDLPLQVGAGGVERLGVELSLIRCDVHAVSQAPDGYAFRVWVATGGAEPFALTVIPHPQLQTELETLVEACLGVDGTTP